MSRNISTGTIKKSRIAFLLLGTIIAWYETVGKFLAFYDYEGTLFKIRDCVTPNPITTPCFWGALAFLLALIIVYRKRKTESKSFEKKMLAFFVACMLFAWGNFAIELAGVQPTPGAIVSPCQASANPLLSACFFGSILFTLSLITTYIVYKRSK